MTGRLIRILLVIIFLGELGENFRKTANVTRI